VQFRYEDVDAEDTPLGRLTLRRYHAETGEVGYEVRIDGHFLMASHGAHSEQAMAALARERLAGEPRPLTVLVGGLGAGHTLRAALDLPDVERVVVVEIGARVVDWNRRYFAEVNGDAVSDPRVAVQVGDLADHVRATAGGVDLMLLDVVMPKLGGHEVYDRIKAKRPEIAVVFCTGFDPETAGAQFLREEGVSLVRKPFDAQTLLQTVRATLDEQRLCTASTT